MLAQNVRATGAMGQQKGPAGDPKRFVLKLKYAIKGIGTHKVPLSSVVDEMGSVSFPKLMNIVSKCLGHHLGNELNKHSIMVSYLDLDDDCIDITSTQELWLAISEFLGKGNVLKLLVETKANDMGNFTVSATSVDDSSFYTFDDEKSVKTYTVQEAVEVYQESSDERRPEERDPTENASTPADSEMTRSPSFVGNGSIYHPQLENAVSFGASEKANANQGAVPHSFSSDHDNSTISSQMRHLIGGSKRFSKNIFQKKTQNTNSVDPPNEPASRDDNASYRSNGFRRAGATTTSVGQTAGAGNVPFPSQVFTPQLFNGVPSPPGNAHHSSSNNNNGPYGPGPYDDDLTLVTKEATMTLTTNTSTKSGIQKILDDIFCSDSDQLTEALSQLRSKTTDRFNGMLIRRAGGIPKIVQFMKKTENEVELQISACLILKQLAQACSENISGIKNAGGISEIVAAMIRFPNDIDLQRYACASLEELSNGSKRTKAAILDADGIRVTLNGMKDFPRDAQLQEHGCGLLKNLSFTGNGSSGIGKAGGIEQLVYAMHRHVKQMSIQKSVSCALRNLSLNDENCSELRERGAIPVVIRSMGLFPHEIEIQTDGCGVLAFLSVDDKNAGIIEEYGGIPEIVGAMKRHRNIVDLQKYGCVALQLFSIKDDNNLAVYNAGGLEVIETAMDLYPNNTDIQDVAQYAKRNLMRVFNGSGNS